MIGREDIAQGGMLSLPCLDGGNLSALVVPVRAETSWLRQQAAAILFIKDPKTDTLPSRDDIRVLFGLTPSQAGLAREILRGDGIDAAAARLGIARSTARSYLIEIFGRTGTSRQAELVRLILDHTLPASRTA